MIKRDSKQLKEHLILIPWLLKTRMKERLERDASAGSQDARKDIANAFNKVKDVHNRVFVFIARTVRISKKNPHTSRWALRRLLGSMCIIDLFYCEVFYQC